MSQPEISIVSPVFKAAEIVDELVRQLSGAVSTITDDFEIILVEDGSPDASWEKIHKNCSEDPKVKGIKLSRNFGQHYALSAGLQEARGKFVVVIDCDLQDDPAFIPELYRKAQEGFDVVFTSKKQRSHSFLKNITAGLFFKVFNFLSDTQTASIDVGSYSMLSRKVVDQYNRLGDAHRHYLMLLRFLGFRSVTIPVTHRQRYSGKSSYNLSRLIRHAINGITSESDKLLRLSIYFGFLLAFFAMLAAAYIIVMYFIQGFYPGWPSIFVAILFSTGMLLISIGITGIYIGKTFEQVKGRPPYIIDQKLNFDSGQ